MFFTFLLASKISLFSTINLQLIVFETLLSSKKKAIQVVKKLITKINSRQIILTGLNTERSYSVDVGKYEPEKL